MNWYRDAKYNILNNKENRINHVISIWKARSHARVFFVCDLASSSPIWLINP
jgi:hypothetical protein